MKTKVIIPNRKAFTDLDSYEKGRTEERERILEIINKIELEEGDGDGDSWTISGEECEEFKKRLKSKIKEKLNDKRRLE